MEFSEREKKSETKTQNYYVLEESPLVQVSVDRGAGVLWLGLVVLHQVLHSGLGSIRHMRDGALMAVGLQGPPVYVSGRYGTRICENYMLVQCKGEIW